MTTATHDILDNDALAAEKRLTLEVRPSTDRDVVLSKWRELEHRIGTQGLMCSADWTEVWLAHYGNHVPHRLVTAYSCDDDRLCGVCLITEGVGQKDGPLKLKTLHVGTAGEPESDSVCVEYNRLLVEPQMQTAMIERLCRYLDSQQGFDQWCLDGIDRAAFEHFQCCNERLTGRAEATHWFDLTVPREIDSNVLAAFKSSTRRKIRRSLEAYSGLSLEWSESLDHAADIFGEMVELHQARWTAAGKTGSYTSERFTRFHEELMARLVPMELMAFVRIRADGETVGCVQLLNDRNRALLYQCGWASAEGKQSPGVVVDYLAMEECLKRGFDAYDFLAYETQHKRHLSNACCDLVWARRRFPGVKFAALDAARDAKQRLRKLLSKSPD